MENDYTAHAVQSTRYDRKQRRLTFSHIDAVHILRRSQLSSSIGSSPVARAFSWVAAPPGKHFAQSRVGPQGGGHSFVEQNATRAVAEPTRQPHLLLRFSRSAFSVALDNLCTMPFSFTL